MFKKLDQNGNLYSERFYGPDGRAYLDIDYTDNHLPEVHSNPHYHPIEYDADGNFIRKENINV